RGEAPAARHSGPLDRLGEEVDLLLGRHREPPTEVGQALADDALRRVQEKDRRLEAAAALDEVGLLPGVLEVVARVRLVGDERDERRDSYRQVEVDLDPRAEAALVPVVAAPRAVPDEPDVERLALRQTERLCRPPA